MEYNRVLSLQIPNKNKFLFWKDKKGDFENWLAETRTVTRSNSYCQKHKIIGTFTGLGGVW